MVVRITQTSEQQRALVQETGGPVLFVTEQGDPTHVIFSVEQARRLLDEHLRRELEFGFEQADRAEWVNWDPVKIKTMGRGQRADRDGHDE